MDCLLRIIVYECSNLVWLNPVWGASLPSLQCWLVVGLTYLQSSFSPIFLLLFVCFIQWLLALFFLMSSLSGCSEDFCLSYLLSPTHDDFARFVPLIDLDLISFTSYANGVQEVISPAMVGFGKKTCIINYLTLNNYFGAHYKINVLYCIGTSKSPFQHHVYND